MTLAAGMVQRAQPDVPRFARNLVVLFQRLQDAYLGSNPGHDLVARPNRQPRQLFGGNLTRQSAYKDVDFRIAGDLKNSDRVTESTFWIGVYPGLTDEMIDYMAESILDFLKSGDRQNV